MPTTPFSALRAALANDPARPLVTYVGPEGRTELSVRTLENNAAKAAGLLRDGLDVEPGDLVRLLMPVHWQASVWLAACWSAGAVATFEPGDAAVVTLATAERLAGLADPGSPMHGEVLRVSRHPFGLPADEPLPTGVAEAAVEVRAYSDVFSPYLPPAEGDRALRLADGELTAGAVMARGAAVARRCGLTVGGRLLVTMDAPPADVPLALLAAPLAVGAAVVLVGDGVELAEVVRTEGVSARL